MSNNDLCNVIESQSDIERDIVFAEEAINEIFSLEKIRDILQKNNDLSITVNDNTNKIVKIAVENIYNRLENKVSIESISLGSIKNKIIDLWNKLLKFIKEIGKKISQYLSKLYDFIMRIKSENVTDKYYIVTLKDGEYFIPPKYSSYMITTALDEYFELLVNNAKGTVGDIDIIRKLEKAIKDNDSVTTEQLLDEINKRDEKEVFNYKLNVIDIKLRVIDIYDFNFISREDDGFSSPHGKTKYLKASYIKNEYQESINYLAKSNFIELQAKSHAHILIDQYRDRITSFIEIIKSHQLKLINDKNESDSNHSDVSSSRIKLYEKIRHQMSLNISYYENNRMTILKRIVFLLRYMEYKFIKNIQHSKPYSAIRNQNY